MLQPTRLISTPFAQEGEKTEIQNVTGEFDNSATYRLGFPPLTMQSIRLGGKPPKGTDFNGVLFDITENISFLCKGGRYQYNAGLSTLIGGYPEGSNLLLDDNVTEVVSTVAGNQNNPNINMTGWILKPNKTTAANVADASGESQQQVNYNGGSKWHSRVGGYLENERVVLANGDIVKSTVDGNVNNPNANRTGWRFDDNTVESIADLIAINNPQSGKVVYAQGFQGDHFKYNSLNASVNNGHSVFNGWERQVPYLHVSPLQWGADPTGQNDSTAAFQAWSDHLSALTLSATYPPVAMIPAGTYTTSEQIVLANIGNCTIYSLGALISGTSANSLDALFKINNAVNTKITGSLTISCNNLENYGSAFKVTASSGGPIDPNGIVSHCDFFGITVEHAKVGYQLGEDLDNWDKHVAELHFVGCESRFVQIALANYGSQTEASFDGSTLAIGYLNEAHTDREYRIMKVKGGIVEYTGGSLINSMIPSGWADNGAIDIKPCKSTTYGNPYPVVSIVNPHIELTSKLLVVSSDFVGADSSFSNINFSGCKGWVELGAAEDFINVYDASYGGKISIDEANNFYTSLGVRTGKNINCASAGTILEVNPSAFGKNFMQGFAGIVGGILKHPLKLISQTSGLNASLATGKQPLVFTTVNGSGDLSRYAIYYTTNGNIQFPYKMKSINIKVNIVDSGINVAGDIFIEKNGAIVCFANKNTAFATMDYTDNDVLSTDVYCVYFNKTGAVTLNSGSVSNISIFAET